MTIDWTTLQGALTTWASTYSGLDAVWSGEPDGWEPKAFVWLDIANVEALGVDVLAYLQDTDADEGEDMVPMVSGNRIVTVAVAVISRDQTPNETARHYLEMLRTSLRLESVKVALRAAGCAFVDASATEVRDEVFEDRKESRGAFSLRIATVVNTVFRDPSDASSFIETLQGTVTLDDEEAFDIDVTGG